MTLDVVIPVYKPGKDLKELVEKLKCQSVRPKQIHIINTEKQYFDAFKEAFDFDEDEESIKVTHITKEEFDHGATRHRGMVESDADIVVMMTQDAVPEGNELFSNLVKNLKDDVAVSSARQIPRQNAGILESLTREFNYAKESSIKSAGDIEKIGIKAIFSSDVCAAYRRDLYFEIGGFCHPTIFNEDMIFAFNALKKGYRVAYEADAKVLHSHAYTIKQQFQRNFDIGVSQTDHPEVFFGIKSESEGIKLVKTTWKRLLEEKKVIFFLPFCVQCFFKLLGYKIGRNYKKLPKSLVYRLSGSGQYWKNREKFNET